jgi:heme/copper-type cytochrome/quinol oxidase subunit 2
LKEIAVPKLRFDLRFQTAAPGRFELLGDHLCGGAVETLQGVLVVEPAQDLCQWLKAAGFRSAIVPHPES